MYWSRMPSLLIALIAASVPLIAVADRAENDYAVAARHYARARWQPAIEEFTAFLQRHPNHPYGDEARFLLGEALVQLGRYERAREALAEFVDAAPDHTYAKAARFRIGEAAFLAGDHEVAEGLLQAFVREFPNEPFNAYALTYLGEIALTAGDGPDAEAHYSRALRDFPQGALHRECRFGLARALEQQGKLDESLRFYRFLAQSPGRLTREAQLRSGVLLYQLGDYAAAIERLRAVEDDLRPGELLTEARYWIARCQFAGGDLATAAATLERADGGQPNHAISDAVVFLLAEARRKSGQLAEAQREYQRLIERWPASSWADDAAQILLQMAFDDGSFDDLPERAADFALRYPDSPLLASVRRIEGRVLLKREEFAGATDVFEQLVLRPSELPAPSPQVDARDVDPADRYLLALAYLGGRRPEDALNQLDRIPSPASTAELEIGVLAARSVALLELKRYDRAVDALAAYLKRQPDGPEAADARAKLVVARAEAEGLDAAAQALDDFRSKAPDHPLLAPTTAFLADRAFAGQRYELARQLFRALSASIDSPQWQAKGWAGLGRTELQQGRPTEAAAAFARLLDAFPDADEAAEAALSRAVALEHQGDLASALRAYAVAYEQYPESEQAPTGMLAAAKLLESTGEPERAADLLARLLDTYDAFPQRDAALYQWAWVSLGLERASESEAAFQQLIDNHPHSRFRADAMFRVAEAAAARGDTELATKQLDQMLAAPGGGEVRCHALYLRGKLAADAEDWPDVVAPMQTIAMEFPGHALRSAAEFWLAEAYYRTNQFDLAQPILDRLENSAATQSAAWLAMVPLRRAQLAARNKDWAMAGEIAATIADRFPEFALQYEADYLIGRCLSREARFSEARAQFQKAIDSPTGSGTETAAIAQWMIGESYFHQKNYQEALRAYHRVEALFPYPRWQAAALLQAAKCRELLNQPMQAVLLYEQVVNDYADTMFAEDARARLDATTGITNSLRSATSDNRDDESP